MLISILILLFRNLKWKIFKKQIFSKKAIVFLFDNCTDKALKTLNV
jgi:hypothetical protein